MTAKQRKSINVYDFDKTIYNGDCTVDFWKFCVVRHPKILLTLPSTVFAFGKYCFEMCNKTSFKEIFFSFLRYVPDIDSEIVAFWDSHFQKIQPWYLQQKQDDDVIISASPAFLIDGACSRLCVRSLASMVDKETGVFFGENCWGDEKVRRFSVAYPDTGIACFYSDSLSDSPLAVLAEKAFIISDGVVHPWDKQDANALTKNLSSKGR